MRSPMLFQKPFDLHTNKAISYGCFRFSSGRNGAIFYVNPQALSVAPSGESFKLNPGMQLSAEIHQNQRTVLEYLLSPVQKVKHEAARER
jgi:hypothetical protein